MHRIISQTRRRIKVGETATYSPLFNNIPGWVQVRES
jgi:hypothetical protein